ncbi:TAXI family TRAP transporter solute-binding subunit [Roseicella aquatilis]|uniref:TAXI family TRAP transporter solute-binding subunit n=1 Tax=Roseicella aquatilis TaxID=2527868 RepID=A0A4R4DU51_9PROT|nr:TAXI family TRAP transporter solute-binding subunit [Roseicella aquatilis]TCZ65548.1 TAXI family TRAP transporter solute-binding subunit [Roseicella aquatilis]
MLRRRYWIAALLAAGFGPALQRRAAGQAPPGWPNAVTLATASPGGTYHAYGAGLARILSRALGIMVEPRDTTGPAENIRLIEAGEAQLGFVTLGAALEAWSGTGDWTGGRQFRAIRALFPMYETPFQFVARRDLDIATVAALEGRSLGVGPPGGTGATYVPRMLARLGIRARLVQGSWAELAARMRAGEVDALAVASGLPFPAIAELEAQRAVRHLPLPRDAIALLRLAIPELSAATVPAGAYPSLARGYETVGIYNLAVAHRDLPADLAYRIVRAVFDSRAELIEAHPAASATVPANFVHNTLLPWHPGAARYFENRAVRGILAGD